MTPKARRRTVNKNSQTNLIYFHIFADKTGLGDKMIKRHPTRRHACGFAVL